MSSCATGASAHGEAVHAHELVRHGRRMQRAPGAPGAPVKMYAHLGLKAAACPASESSPTASAAATRLRDAMIVAPFRDRDKSRD